MSILNTRKRNTALREDLIETKSYYQHRLRTDMYSICCCCLELPCLKSLWSEYIWMGDREVYNQMLYECFNIRWPREVRFKDQICEVCITQLRNALQFKQRILQSLKRLEAKNSSNNKNTNITYEEKDHQIDTVDDESIKTEDFICDETDIVNGANKNDTIYNDNNDEYDDKLTKIEDDDTDATVDDEKQTIILKEPNSRRSIEICKMNYTKPRKNACLIIENSTIMPFKSCKGYFTCLYCNKQHVGFDELKAHVFQLHENPTFKTILKSISRPNDRIKADVSDIACKICKKKVDNLETLVSHLAGEHNVKFNLDDAIKPVDSILGYDLSDGKFKCCVCKSEFLFFKTLTNHMNTHSSDYVCDVCGKCFLLPERLRAHIQMHVDGKDAKCGVCDKVCANKASLKSHIRYMHKKMAYMCSLCNKTFTNYVLRIKHLEEVHKRAPLNLGCRICFKKYSTPKSLNNHMRTEHLRIGRELKHSCNMCGMRFKFRNTLACHMIVHSDEKKFECEVCHKRYARAKTLKEHLKIHRNDKRWSCAACEQGFVQKCSLKNHIRVHHGDMDSEELIVYKKPKAE